MSKIVIYAHWKVISYDGMFYINSTHLAYLEHLSSNSNVSVLCHIFDSQDKPLNHSLVSNVDFINLPSPYGYLNSYLKVIEYIKLFKKVQNKFDIYYVRIPDPLGWLFSLFNNKSLLVHHFVGDSIDATIKSSSPIIIKIMKIALYIPEHFLTLLTTKFCSSYTYSNGNLIAKRLVKYGISCDPVVSSTLSLEDAINRNDITSFGSDLKFLYVGYVRRSKGVLNLVKAFAKYSKDRPGSTLTIVGDGDAYQEVFGFVNSNNLTEVVSFLGHIDDREQLKGIYRAHDIFCFASLSEGSPRVVIEAMFNGLLVVSTKVGSLPDEFQHMRDIIFSDNFGEESFYEALKSIQMDEARHLESVRINGFDKAISRFTKEKFLDRVFYDS